MSNTPLPTYGGQAVIEGVLMRGANAAAIAMRDPQGEIILHTEPLGAIYHSRMAKIPFLRGLVMLWDALSLGTRALTISANIQGDEEEQLEGFALFTTIGISLLITVGLFFMTPAAGAHYLEAWLNIQSPWVGNLLEGIIRLIILVGYIWAIGQMEDIKRVFGYHGAEHKTINAFEAGAELTPEIAQTYPIEHPRCGTAFLLTVVVFSIILFTLMGPRPSIWVRIGARVVLIPVLASLAYEYIRWTAKHLDSPLVQLIIKPNLALQHLTTIEPDLDMLEVAIASFNAMRDKEEEFSVL